ncbi:MAG: IS6 family transposase [Nitrososphaera sp.]
MVIAGKVRRKRGLRKSILGRAELRGAAIVIKGGQITRLNDKHFLVKSQSAALADRHVSYGVKWKKTKWTCQCPDFSTTMKPCEHIHAVNILLKLPQIVMANLDALEGACPDCGSNNIIMKGFRYNKSGAVRKYRCNDCPSWFKNPVTHEDINSNIAAYVIAVDLFFKKLSLREIQNHLYQIYNIEKGVTTLHTWILKFIELVKQSIKHIKFDAGKKWSADEMVIKVKGKKMHLWNILDPISRYHIISMLASGRGTKEAEKVIDGAIKKIGKEPKKFTTDGLSSYCEPLAQRNIEHIGNVGIAGKDANNNKVERLHNTIRGFVRAKRGMKNKAQTLLEGHQIYYNSVRPSMALNGKVPHLVAKDNRWISLITNRAREGVGICVGSNDGDNVRAKKNEQKAKGTEN